MAPKGLPDLRFFPLRSCLCLPHSLCFSHTGFFIGLKNTTQLSAFALAAPFAGKVVLPDIRVTCPCISSRAVVKYLPVKEDFPASSSNIVSSLHQHPVGSSFPGPSYSIFMFHLPCFCLSPLECKLCEYKDFGFVHNSVLSDQNCACHFIHRRVINTCGTASYLPSLLPCLTLAALGLHSPPQWCTEARLGLCSAEPR